MRQQLQIETTNHCNAHCVFCPIDEQERPRGVMQQALFDKIVSETADRVAWPDIAEVSLQGLGEPLIDKRIVERVKQIADARKDWMTTLYTNGSLLTPEKALALEDAGLSVLLVSINAASTNTRWQIMKLDDYERVVQNVRAAIKSCKRLKIVPKAVVNMDLLTGDESDRFAQMWIEARTKPMMHFEGNWAGTTWKARTVQQKGCHRALGQLMVLWDGRVSLCCFDAKGEVVFGDLKEQTLREVYTSPEWVRYRETHGRGEKKGLRLCEGCTEI